MIGQSWSKSWSVQKTLPCPDKEHKNGEHTMSLCLAISTYNALYLAADSRSSVGVGDKTVSGCSLKYYIKTDDYVKLACIKMPNADVTDVAVFSTGANCFNGNKTFTECLSEIPLHDVTSVKEGIERVESYFTKQLVQDLYISFFLFYCRRTIHLLRL